MQKIKLHPESAKMFQVDAEAEKAKQAALRLLGGRAYSRKELLDKLRGRGFKRQAVEETMATLERLGLIDEKAFARRYVEDRMRLRPMGRSLLALELKRRGIAPDLVDEILEDALEGVDLAAVALGLLNRRQARYRRVEREKAFSRMFGFLGRRGFEGGLVRDVVKQAWREWEEAEVSDDRLDE